MTVGRDVTFERSKTGTTLGDGVEVKWQMCNDGQKVVIRRNKLSVKQTTA